MTTNVHTTTIDCIYIISATDIDVTPCKTHSDSASAQQIQYTWYVMAV